MYQIPVLCVGVIVFCEIVKIIFSHNLTVTPFKFIPIVLCVTPFKHYTIQWYTVELNTILPLVLN